MEKQQTAVEWLEEQWLKLDLEFTGLIDTKEYDKRRNFIIEQAKAIEKGQIEEALLTGLVHWNVDKPISEYYNETFKSE